MAEEDLLIPLGIDTFTAASDNETLYGAEVFDLGLGLHLVNLIGNFHGDGFRNAARQCELRHGLLL
jgi:hypothetical protein